MSLQPLIDKPTHPGACYRSTPAALRALVDRTHFGRALASRVLLAITFLVLLVAAAGLPSAVSARESGESIRLAPDARHGNEVTIDQLPVQAQQTLALIRKGGPFPYRKDGTVFGNFERLLPRKPRGYYTEYTVPTPYARDRGARRIVAGGEPGRLSEFYYTEDHYGSFRKIRDSIP